MAAITSTATAQGEGRTLTAAAYSRAMTRAEEKLARYEREVARAEARYVDSLTRW